MTLDNPTILLRRDNAGWNFNRFVKTRRNTGGRGAPTITMESVAIKNGHLIVNDRGRLVEDLTRLNTQFRFAYEKPGIAISIRQFAADAGEMHVRRLAGDLRFDRGSVQRARPGDRDRPHKTGDDASATAGRRSGCSTSRSTPSGSRLPEIGRYFRPIANIKLEPAVDVKARGTLDELKMDVNVVSSAGTARGPLVGHFGSGVEEPRRAARRA